MVSYIFERILQSNHLCAVPFVCMCVCSAVWVHVIHFWKTLKLGFLISLETTMASFILVETYSFHQDMHTELCGIIYIMQNAFYSF